MHISLTWDGASGRTSFWDGTPLAPFCESPRSFAAVAAGGRAQDPTVIPPVRVLSTRDGVGLASGPGYGSGGYGDWYRSALSDDHGDVDGGWPDDVTGAGEPPADPFAAPSVDPPADPTVVTPPVPSVVAPCRVRPSRWHGDADGVLTQVTGQGGVPTTGVVAVAVTVRAIRSTAPAQISVWGPGQEEREVVMDVRLNRDARGSAIVPVAVRRHDRARDIGGWDGRDRRRHRLLPRGRPAEHDGGRLTGTAMAAGRPVSPSSRLAGRADGSAAPPHRCRAAPPARRGVP